MDDQEGKVACKVGDMRQGGVCTCSRVHGRWLVLTVVTCVTISACALLVSLHAQRCTLSDSERQVMLSELRKQILSELLEPVQFHQQNAISLSQGYEAPTFHRVIKRAVEETKKKKKRKGKGKGKKKDRCSKRCKRGKRGPPGPPGPPGKDGHSAAQKQTIRAAHYTPRFWEDMEAELIGRTLCVYVDNWSGKVCRNRTLEMKYATMNFFHPAPWVEQNSHIHSPAEQLHNGSFLMKDEGLYLIYSSVLFYDSKMKESQAVSKRSGDKDTTLFRCMEGVDYINSTYGRDFNSKYRSCSISGVTYLKKGDMITVKNLYNNTIIDLTEDATFFGLVQLVPGPPHHHHRHHHHPLEALSPREGP